MTQLPTSPELGPFWSAASRGELMLPCCGHCGRKHWYPRHLCPFCHATGMDWQHHDGSGEIVSYTVVRRSQEPYVPAYVRLDDGPTVLTTIVGADLERLSIRQRVRARFQPGPDDRPVLVFEPSEQDRAGHDDR